MHSRRSHGSFGSHGSLGSFGSRGSLGSFGSRGSRCSWGAIAAFGAISGLSTLRCSEDNQADGSAAAGSSGGTGGAHHAEVASTGSGSGAANGTNSGAATVSSSSTSTGAASGSGGGDPCSACAMPVSKGTIAASAITEVSGLVASALHDDRYYVHNDSGDTARFFAVGLDGSDHGSYVVGGATAIDWEAMAAGPCDKGRCLYFGDVGDNLEARSSYTIYRVPEPARLTPGEHQVTGEALEFVYPDGSHNCETLLAHPKSGELWLVTKVSFGSATVYRVPASAGPGKSVVLDKLGTVKPPSGLPQFTAGDVHPSGTGILMRTYSSLFYYPLASNDVAAALALPPCSVPVAAEKQGEAVSWSRTGDGYVTVSEGSKSAVNSVSCP
ncbi:MAG: hypothetical protein EXR75_01300 [Myxococcales bacterium]|nr:hypothetical protein [Myxococcales bacterium]